MKIQIPENCRKIMDRLTGHGFEAYIVGGCVRDALLGLRPNDWDITTNALPSEVTGLLSHENGFFVIPTGEKYGTVTVLARAEKEAYEVTTYRLDGDYTDGRRPDSVTFSRKLSDDLLRRDFTINAMAYRDDTGIIDMHGGLDDLNRRRIRLVGDAHARLKEDGLRVMRAVRLAYKLKFDITTDTYDALADAVRRGYLDNISGERICHELVQTISCFYAGNGAQELFAQLLLRIIPELKDVQLPLDAIAAAPPITSVRLALLLLDSGGSAEDILNRLKFDNKTSSQIQLLIRYHAAPPMTDKTSVKRLLSKIGKENFELLLGMRSQTAAGERQLLEAVVSNNECYSLKDLKINGADLKKLGLKGRMVGIWLNACLDLVICDNAMNDKERLLQYVSTHMSND